MESTADLYKWLENFTPQDQVGIDEGGLTLRIVTNGVLTKAYYEVGGIPEDIEHAGILEERYAKATNCDTDELKLLHVRYGGDCGLVSLTAGILLASAYNTSTFSVPSGVPSVTVYDSMVSELYGEEHSWGDIIPMLQEHYDWQLKCLPDLDEIKKQTGTEP